MSEKRGSRSNRFLDRYVGIPTVFLLGAFTRRRTVQECVKRIGLISLGTIGDALLVASTADDLRVKYPDARITLVVSHANRGVTSLLPQVDNFLVLSLSKPISVLRMLRSSDFDLLIDFLQWPRISAVYVALAGARFTLGFRTPGQHRHYAYDRAVDHSGALHELENFRGLVRGLGVAAAAAPRIFIPSPDVEAVRGRVSGPYVVFHPWAAGFMAHMREWPIQGYVDLAKALAARGFQVIVTGGPEDREKTAALVEAGKQQSVALGSMAGCLTLPQTAALVASARLVVSVSTGISHLTAALNVPLVALYGPTSPDRWGPIGPHVIVVTPRGDVGGYHYLGFEYPRDPVHCMELISAERVTEAVIRALGIKDPGIRSSTSAQEAVEHLPAPLPVP